MNKASKIILFVLIACWAMACSKKGVITEVPATDNIDTTNGATKYSGVFSSTPGESVSGTALVLLNGGVYSVALKNMNIGNDLIMKDFEPHVKKSL